ncbi:isoprenylcysteine carboxylmethyltransferase family protein [Dactylosporangium sp. NBC_01737]|uniref:methyltransferase family protein n=1 Tax=Dactylosporangium sp. NBC_01737 TaxID=2975959 RepID=UPI002E14ED9B|nr:isoprenylcysteine carboxylmethyltransferase family protein [Dactylosporangium sp. NBC_01737]
MAWSLVAAQGFLLAALVLLPGGRGWPTPWWLVAGSAAMIIAAVFLALAGALRLGAGLTASPLPSDAARLRTGGVYAYVRHPIYTALLLGGAGVVLLAARPARIWVWLALLALLWSKTILEERALTARFPDYPAYAARTPRLVPDVLRRRRNRAGLRGPRI